MADVYNYKTGQWEEEFDIEDAEPSRIAEFLPQDDITQAKFRSALRKSKTAFPKYEAFCIAMESHCEHESSSNELQARAARKAMESLKNK